MLIGKLLIGIFVDIFVLIGLFFFCMDVAYQLFGWHKDEETELHLAFILCFVYRISPNLRFNIFLLIAISSVNFVAFGHE